MRRVLTLVLLVFALVLLAGAIKYPQILDSWSSGEGREYRKVIVVAITDDPQARQHFENKFVSHLRVRNIEAITSRSIVPDLNAEEDREKILAEIKEQAIEAAFAVRLIALKDRTEEEWGAEWKAALEEDLSTVTLREVIRETQPVSLKSAKRFGVEVGIWDVATTKLVWVGRTDAYKRGEISDSGGAFAEVVLNVLEDEGMFRR